MFQCANRLGFLEILEKIYSCKWIWTNFPTAYHGKVKDKEKDTKLSMEAIIDDIIFIWNVFFGVTGCKNDLTILEDSTLIGMIDNGKYPVICQ